MTDRYDEYEDSEMHREEVNALLRALLWVASIGAVAVLTVLFLSGLFIWWVLT